MQNIKEVSVIDLQKQLDEANKNLKQKEDEKNKMIENLNKQMKSLFDKNVTLNNEKQKVIEEKDKLINEISFESYKRIKTNIILCKEIY